MTWARINARRLGWALAALILGALTLDAHALTPPTPPACPDGMAAQFGIVSKTKFPDNPNLPMPPCVVGATFGSFSAANAACEQSTSTQFTLGGSTYQFLAAELQTPGGNWINAGGSGASETYNLGIKQRTKQVPNGSPTDNPSVSYTIKRQCSNAPTCTDPAGTPRRITNTGSTTPAATVCLNQCSYTLATGPVISLAGGGSARAAYTSTGEQCGSATPDNTISPNGTPLTDGENTVSGYEDGQQCGTVNGETVCVDAGPPPGQCTVTAGGQSVCTESPGTPNTAPPAPNNGEHLNTPATPDVTINNGTTVTNVYNSTTVNNSNALITNGEGDGQGEGDGDCDPETEDCEGEGGDGNEKGRVTGQGGTARTFGASNATIYNAAIESPLGQAVAGIAGSFPTAGTCPPIAFDVPIIGSVATEVHCDIFDGQVRPVLATVMLAVYAVFAVMIILGRN